MLTQNPAQEDLGQHALPVSVVPWLLCAGHRLRPCPGRVPAASARLRPASVARPLRVGRRGRSLPRPAAPTPTLPTPPAPQEGKAASLAADFSITQFAHLGRLLMVHGRRSYKRSAALGQFVMHRGLLISTMQVVVWV